MAAELKRAGPALRSTASEEAVLGALMIDAAAWERVQGKIVAADFAEPRHRAIFAAIEARCVKRVAADAVTVAEQLERTGELAAIGGMAYVVSLSRNTPSAANVEHYTADVVQRSTLRQLRELAGDLVSCVDEGMREAPDLIAATQEWLNRLQNRSRTGRGLVDASTLIGLQLENLDRRADGPTGLRVGLEDFDRLSGGLEPGELVVIAGRPGMGKTALLCSIAAWVAREHQVAIFSAEMTSDQLMRRILARAAQMPQGRLRDPRELADAEWEQITRGATDIGALRLSVDDTPGPALGHVRAECASLKARKGLGVVMVDYLQLLTDKGRNRYEELRSVAYGLKNLAKELNVPVIALAQVNREVEGRDHKRPNVSDLRDSGAIEEAADVVGLLYAEGYYDPSFAMPYVLECSLRKVRNGTPGQCLWHFNGERSHVEVLDSGAAVQYRRLLAERVAKRRTGADL